MAIAHQSTAGSQAVSATSTITVNSVVVDSGTNRVLIVRVSGEGDGASPQPQVTAVSRDGQSGTRIGRAEGAVWSWAEIWKIVGPNVGTSTLTVTLDAADDAGGGTPAALARVDVYTGVDQTTPNRTAATATGSSTTASATVGSVVAGDLVIDIVDVDGGGKTLTVGADQTSDFTDGTSLNGTDDAGSSQAGSSGGVMSWTWSGSSPWSIVATALIAASSGSTIPQTLSTSFGMSAGWAPRTISRTRSVTMTLTATKASSISRLLSAASALTATVIRAPGRLLTSSFGMNSTAARSVSRALAASTTWISSRPSAVLGRSLQTAVSLVATPIRALSRALSAAFSLSATIASVKVKLLTLTASFGMAPTLGRTLSRTQSAIIGWTAALSRSISRTRSAAISWSASVASLKVKVVTLTTSFGLSASFGPRTITRAILAGLPLGPARSVSVSTVRSAALTTAATVSRAPARTLSAATALAASRLRTVGKRLNSTLAFVGTMPIKALARTLTAPLVYAPAYARTIGRRLAAPVGWAADILKVLIPAGSGASAGSGFSKLVAAVQEGWIGVKNARHGSSSSGGSGSSSRID